MNPHTIRRLFPNASKSIIAANAQDYGKPHAEDTLPLAAVERNSSHAPLETKEVQRRTDGRFLVRVESVRKRLADEDGLCEKYVLDCCRYAGLIPDDSPELCKVETSQRKAAKGEEEHTLIEIIYP
jgi:hypothetical protein